MHRSLSPEDVQKIDNNLRKAAANLRVSRWALRVAAAAFLLAGMVEVVRGGH